MDAPESTVRSWLDESIAIRKSAVKDRADILKNFVDEHDYVDIGPGTELFLDCTRTSFKNSVKMLEDQGYQVQYYRIDQMGTNHKTTVTVLAKPGSPYRTGEDKYDISSIASRVVDDNGNVTNYKSHTSFESMKRDLETGRFIPLEVNFTNSNMTVKDKVGATHHVVTDNGLYNLQCREYWFDGKNTEVNAPLFMASDVVVHQIDGVLMSAAKRPWRDIVKEALGIE